MLVRRDQSFGQIVVQTAHACIEATRQFINADLEHPHLIAVHINSEEKLLKEHQRLLDLGIRCILFREPDIGNQATAIATEPIYGDRRRHFRKYQLVKPPNNKI